MENPTAEETVEIMNSNKVEDEEQQPSEDKTNLFQEECIPVTQGQYAHEQITPERNCVYSPEEDPQYEDLTAVDLRTSRAMEHIENLPDTMRQFRPNQKETISIAQLIENFYYNDPSGNKNSPRYFLVTTPSSKGEYLMSNHETYEDNHDYVITDYPTSDQTYPQSMYAEGTNYPNCWDAETNTEPVLKVDQETQTWIREVREVSVQTDAIAYSLMKNTKPMNFKYTCSLCQRLYSSKSSYDRHLRTHSNNGDRKMIADVHFTTQAKLQIYKKHMSNGHLQNPIVIQMPRKAFRCDICERCFPSQIERESHECIVEPFSMTKCPHCPVKCYTVGALNDHIKYTHNIEHTQGTNNQYYCVFCNMSFENGYNFHLHLDKHLSP
uniref:C2H2-type domain-containing protein n=1 Tax=Homalodisca liturata TaxID=320908 RepID=A0A1B6K2L7_9HEMI